MSKLGICFFAAGGVFLYYGLISIFSKESREERARGKKNIGENLLGVSFLALCVFLFGFITTVIPEWVS